MAKQLKPKDEATADDILNEAKKAAPKGQEPAEKEVAPQPPTPETDKGNSGESNPAVTEKPAEQPVPTPEPRIRSQEDEDQLLREEREHEAQEKAELEKKRLTKKYGPDFVVAQRQGLTTIFTRSTWNQLKPDRRGNRDGWREALQIPPEVAHLDTRKA